MLGSAKEQHTEFTKWANVFFAIWLHDAVQQYGVDSELKSAQLSSKAPQELGAEQSMIDHVYRIILSSKTHDSSTDYDTALFIDCDLSILASSAQDYQHYSYQCRQEYSIPDFIYRRGRRTFLKNMLNRSVIYQTPVFRSALETQARANIALELNSLGG